jgi:hypothetical protein
VPERVPTARDDRAGTIDGINSGTPYGSASASTDPARRRSPHSGRRRPLIVLSSATPSSPEFHHQRFG